MNKEPITMRQLLEKAKFNGLNKDYSWSAGYGNNKDMIRRMMHKLVVAYGLGWRSALIFTKDGYNNIRCFSAVRDSPMSKHSKQMIYPVPVQEGIDELNNSKQFVEVKKYDRLHFANKGFIHFKGKYTDNKIYLKKFNKNKMLFMTPYGGYIKVSELKYYYHSSKDLQIISTVPKEVEERIEKAIVADGI